MASRIFRLFLVFAVVEIFHHAYCSTLLSTNDSDNLIKPPPSRLTTLPLPVTLSPKSTPPNTLWAALNTQVDIPCLVQWTSASATSIMDHQQRGPEVKWLRDGVEVDGGSGNVTQASMSVTVTNGTQGRYECLVKYGGGDGILRSSPVQLRIASLHEFTIYPEDIVAEEGQPAMFFCSVNSKPAANITWLRNNLPISNTLSADRCVVLSTGTLVIKKVHSSDLGIFRCKALNIILNKSRLSKRAKLRLHPKTSITKGAEILASVLETNVTAIYGQTLELYCFATGNPEPSIQWYKDGFMVGENNILTLINVTENHSGYYNCTAANNIYISYQSYNVNVLRPPYFNVTPKSVSFPSAKAVRLHCEAKGNPPPRIYWLKNGRKLDYDGRVKLLQNELLLSHSFSTDAGIYQCVAENRVGQAWHAARLSITMPYGQPLPPQNVTCRPYEANSICLQWRAPHGLNDLAYSVHTTDMETTKMLTEQITNDTDIIIRQLNANATYSFYVRGYMRSASDQSQTVNCTTFSSTGSTASRRWFTVELTNENSAWLKWQELSSDVPCATIREDEGNVSYKLQWRHISTPSIHYTITIVGRRYLLTALIRSTVLHPSRYRFHIQPVTSAPTLPTNIVVTNTTSPVLHSAFSKSYPAYEYTVPMLSTSGSNDVVTVYDEDELLLLERGEVEEELDDDDDEFLPPYDLSVELSGHDSVRLSWEDDNVDVGFYTVCYAVVVVLEEEKETGCGGGPGSGSRGQAYKKCTTKFAHVNNLQQNTLYEFRVRTHAIDDITSAYSDPIQVNTKDLLSSAVQNLSYYIINASCVCVTWQQPSYLQNSTYTNYTVAYTIKQKKSENGWHYITVTSGPGIKSCNRSDGGDKTTFLQFGKPITTSSSEMSLLLSELKPNLNYSLYVQSPGSYPGVTITISTKRAIVSKTDNEEVEYNNIDNELAQIERGENNSREQILGAIVGVCISVPLILAVVCWVKIYPWWRRRRDDRRRRHHNMAHLNDGTDCTALTGNGQIHSHRIIQPTTLISPSIHQQHNTNNNGAYADIIGIYDNGVGMRSLCHDSSESDDALGAGGRIGGGRGLASLNSAEEDNKDDGESVELYRLLRPTFDGAADEGAEDGRVVWRRRSVEVGVGEFRKNGLVDCIHITENPQYTSNGNDSIKHPSTNDTPLAPRLNNNKNIINNCRQQQQFLRDSPAIVTQHIQQLLLRRQSPTLAPNG